MNDSWAGIQRIAKRAFATGLFVLLLLGASAAAFSALAAGVTALSNVRGSYLGQTGQPAAQQVPAAGASVPQGLPYANGGGTRGLSGTAVPAQPFGQANPGLANSGAGVPTLGQGQTAVDVVPSLTDRINYQLDHMHSPISSAIDSGGVVLNQKIQHTFGRFMANLLQFLFVEQSDGSPSAHSSNLNPALPGGNSYGTGSQFSTPSGGVPGQTAVQP